MKRRFQPYTLYNKKWWGWGGEWGCIEAEPGLRATREVASEPQLSSLAFSRPGHPPPPSPLITMHTIWLESPYSTLSYHI